jgi:molybdopterin converting factor small subunit
MLVRVRFLGPFRQLAGGEERTVELPAATTIGGLLKALPSMLPEGFGISFAKQVEGFGPALLGSLVLINYRPLRESGGEGLILREGDVVSLVPPMAGG